MATNEFAWLMAEAIIEGLFSSLQCMARGQELDPPPEGESVLRAAA